MKNFTTILKDILSVRELRWFILNTIGFLIVFRLGFFVKPPGLVPKLLEQWTDIGIFGLLDTFLSGTLSRVSIFGLGVLSYISLSLIIFLLSTTIPYFRNMRKNGKLRQKS